METVRHWINGRPTEGIGAQRGPVFDPAAGLQTKEVCFASVDDVNTAVQAAL